MSRSKAPVLLRYRFRSIAQLSRHLHTARGRTLFFYREPGVELSFGARVFMEIILEDTEQSVLLRGSVLSAVGEPTRGTWLEFAETRLSQTVTGGGLVGRKQRRLGCEAMVEIQQNETRTVGRMVDVSMGGARIVDAFAGLDPDVAVQVRLLAADPSWPSDIGLAKAIRAEGGKIALRFVRSDLKTRVAVTRLFAAVREQWARACEASHPAVCCVGGVQLDPAPPRLDFLHKRHQS